MTNSLQIIADALTSGTKKYEFVPEDTVKSSDGKTLTRIKALVAIPLHNVKIGDLGGYLESEKNLSHEGDCWVGDKAHVYDDAQVLVDAIVFGNARVYGNARVLGTAGVYGKTRIHGDEHVLGKTEVKSIESISK